MDAQAQLALMAKAKLVFENGDKFLSFPALTPLAYSPPELDFSRSLADPRVGHALAGFSHAVNRTMTGPLDQGADGPFLWEAYDRWLSDMQLAQDAITPEEQAAYDNATAVLTVVGVDGFATDSPTLVAYKQRRDAWFSAVQSYKAEQLTSGASADPAVQDNWRTVREPQLRALVAEAEAAWERDGFRATVEQAQALRARLDARRPSRAWSTWRSAFMPDIDLLTDPLTGSAVSYAPTAFAPSDLLEQDWPTFTLSGAEIGALVAPAALRDLFAGGGGGSTVAALAFEFCSASLVRPWFRPDLFGAAFWRFRDDAPPLSDGADPPQGTWPAYVTGVVFARNIRMTTAAEPQRPQPMAVLPRAALRADLVRTPPGDLPVADEPAPLVRRGLARRLSPAMMSRLAETPAMEPEAAVLRSQPTAAADASPMRASAAMRLNTLVYHAAPKAVTLPTNGGIVWWPPTTPPPPPVETTDKVSILAFICTPVPRTPDPDQNLQW